MTSKIFNEGAKYLNNHLDKNGKEIEILGAENPYINGPDTPDKALEWWRGMNHARNENRIKQQTLPKKNKVNKIPDSLYFSDYRASKS